jgi:predicted nuclease of predicted toxin-antitoxin system
MLQGYADEHVSDAIVGALQARGMDVVSVAQLGRQGTDDAILLDQALTERRVLLACDTDFLRIANERWVAGITFACIVFWPQQQRPLKHVVSQVIHVATIHTFEEACSRVFYL